MSSANNTLFNTHFLINLKYGGSHTLEIGSTQSGESYIDFIQ